MSESIDNDYIRPESDLLRLSPTTCSLTLVLPIYHSVPQIPTIRIGNNNCYLPLRDAVRINEIIFIKHLSSLEERHYVRTKCCYNYYVVPFI